MDMGLLGHRGFAAGAAANFVLGTALFGVALLLPLYFEILRGRSPLQTGLLLAPQGLGAAIAISLAGYLTDKPAPAAWPRPEGSSPCPAPAGTPPPAPPPPIRPSWPRCF